MKCPDYYTTRLSREMERVLPSDWAEGLRVDLPNAFPVPPLPNSKASSTCLSWEQGEVWSQIQTEGPHPMP